MRWSLGSMAAIAAVAAALPALAVTPQRGAGALLSDVTVAELAELIEGFGYAAEVTRQDDGSSYVDVWETRQRDYWIGWIGLMNCDEQSERCTDMMFFSNWDQGADPDYIHRWNADSWYGTAIVNDSGNPMVVWTSTMDGGVSKDWLKAHLGLWNWMVQEFESYIADDPSLASAADTVDQPAGNRNKSPQSGFMLMR